MDAAAQVDARYRFAPAFRISRPVSVAAPRSTQGVIEEASVVAAPPAGSVWGQEIGRDERAFFDPTIGAEPPRVRVHHAAPDEPPWSPGLDAPPSRDGDAQDGWIDAAGSDADQPEPAAG